MATFNGARYLHEQLVSFVSQTRLPDEIVVSDDCSTDGTLSILKDFANSAPCSVQILANSENVGYTRNFERALGACRGDFVFLSDQDDVWYPRKIETMIASMMEWPDACLAIHDLRFCDSELRPTGDTKLGRIRWIADPQHRYVTGMATVVRQSFLECALPIPSAPGITHDRWLHECASALCGKRIIEEVLADYRRHDANATAGTTINSPASLSRGLTLLEKLKSPRSSVETRARLLAQVASWLETAQSCAVAAEIAPPLDFHELQSEYRSHARLAERRVDVLCLPRYRRVIPIAKLWLSGGYVAFNGIRSAVLDLVRR